MVCSEPVGRPISASRSATLSQTQVGGRSRKGVADRAAIACSCAVGVEHQERGVVLLVESQLADATRIGVLGDVALPAAVDQDAAHHQLRVDQERHFGGVHVGQVGAKCLRHPDRDPVMLFDGGSRPAGDPRRIPRHHRLVVGEAAGGQHHPAPRPHSQLVAVLPGDDADHPPVALDDQPLHPGIHDALHTQRGGGVHQRLHQHVAAALFAGSLVLHLRHMSARRGRGDLVVREGILAAGVHQPVVIGRFPARLTPEAGLERHTAVHQPVEMLEAARAVVGDSVLVGARPHRRAQKGPHVVDGILEAASFLDRRAAAEIDESAGQRRGAAPAAGALQHHHLGAGPCGLDRRRRAGDAVAGDHHVGLDVPVCDVASVDGGDRRGHIAASGWLPDQSWPQ